MPQPAVDSDRTLDDNEFSVRHVPLVGGLRVAEAVAVFRIGDKFCATQSHCPHRGGPLDEGQVEGTVLTCPWHGAQFEICTGALLRGPAQTPLETYHVTVEGEIGRIDVE